MKSYLHTFDRRNSDTNYLLGRRSSGERVNLADEIRKLSDHLMMLADINNKLAKESELTEELNNNEEVKSETIKKTKKKSEEEKTEKPKKSSNISSSSNSSIKTASSSFNSSSSNTTSKSTFNNSKIKSNSIAMRLQQSIEETPKLTNGTTWKSTVTTSSTSNIAKKQSTLTCISNSNTQSTAQTSNTSLETASSRRAKFRINQMSRDVPIGLPNTHQAVNLEEAANTKDCLLHLLEKYNETKTRNPMGRHQSISVDWNVSDNLEYRSMSSINAFFQRHNNTGENVRQLQAQLEAKTLTKEAREK